MVEQVLVLLDYLGLLTLNKDMWGSGSLVSYRKFMKVVLQLKLDANSYKGLQHLNFPQLLINLYPLKLVKVFLWRQWLICTTFKLKTITAILLFLMLPMLPLDKQFKYMEALLILRFCNNNLFKRQRVKRLLKV